MRRALVAALVAGATLLTASACSLPPGTDGDLVNQWSAMAEPTGWEPKAGTCHKSFNEQSYRANYTPVDCTGDHTYETVYIGQFTGDAARAGLPEAKGATAKAALAECAGKVNEFIGGEAKDGRIWFGISTPSKGTWEGGARWFRCEVAAREDFWGQPITWKKSLKGEFAAASDLKYGCYQIPENDDEDWVPLACGESHNAEFAGNFQLDVAYDDITGNKEGLHKSCRSTIASYVGVPDDNNLKYRTGTYVSFPRRADWDAGYHFIRCHIYLSKKQVTKSLKGAGTGGLPINYA